MDGRRERQLRRLVFFLEQGFSSSLRLFSRDLFFLLFVLYVPTNAICYNTFQLYLYLLSYVALAFYAISATPHCLCLFGFTTIVNFIAEDIPPYWVRGGMFERLNDYLR